MKKLLLLSILLILGCNSNKRDAERWSQSMVETTLKTQNMQEALEIYKKATEKFDIEDYEGAIKELNRALIRYPDFTNAYFSRGTAKMLGFDDYKGAIEDFTEVINLSPNNEHAYYERGYAKLISQDTKGAIEDFTKAIDINNGLAIAYEYRAYAKEILEDFKGACDDFMKVYVSGNGDPSYDMYLEYYIKNCK